MKSRKERQKQITSRESLAGRLMAYSVMAGAALAFMPAADGALVVTNKYTMVGAPSPICNGFVQGQHIHSQKVRHHRRAGMRALSNPSCGSSTSTSNGGE